MGSVQRQNGNNNIWVDAKKQNINPAIMQSLDSLSLSNRDGINSFQYDASIPGNISRHKISSLAEYKKSFENFEEPGSFLLIDGKEYIKVSNYEQFIKKLNIPNNDLKVKVISIFGNTGDGKSHTLNQVFFEGEEVFKTSDEQNSCTLGVWAAFDPKLNIVCLDTEGLLGVTTHENERTRMLLKVLAISDIVIYRTRSERLHKDMFNFLSAASRAYTYHFHSALHEIGTKEGVLNSATALGPSVIIFHETKHTKPLSSDSTESAEDVLRDRFAQMELKIEAYSSIKYVGVQTLMSCPTDFKPFQKAIVNELKNTTVRSARKPQLVYNTLKTINDKFSGKIESPLAPLFPDQYFTCPAKCFSCNSRCQNSMGHLREDKPHSSDTRCKFQHQYENLVYICKKCYSNGNEVIVTSRIQTQNDTSWYSLAKYAWSGYVIECPNCGEIYRSRQYWYGNQDPEDGAVRTEITHVWDLPLTQGTSQNTAQRLIDGVSYLSETVTNYSIEPTKALTSWVADQVAPAYWRPNHEIKECYQCHKPFGSADTKHHCRQCGEGFCHPCSSETKCIPERNWFTPVRVCIQCYEKEERITPSEGDGVGVRKVSEHVVSTFSAVGQVLNFSKEIIKDSVRPSYWIPDADIVHCCVCQTVFSDIVPLHHCRDCGHGVCQSCSQNRRPVPRRGWDTPVRVCDGCLKID